MPTSGVLVAENRENFDSQCDHTLEIKQSFTKVVDYCGMNSNTVPKPFAPPVSAGP